MDTEVVEKLALRCVAHLQQEEAMLRESFRIVEATRESLLLRDGALLQVTVDQQRHTATAADALRTERERMRTDIAQTLDVAHDRATVSNLAKQASDAVAKELRATQQRLTRLAARVQTLHRANAVLALQTNHMVAGALQKLIGAHLSETSYARNGERQRSAAPGWIDTNT